jgi:glycosyltransferase involved in cell wall biosynthesis
MKKLTIITPCYNEESNVLECYQEVKKIFNEKLKNYQYEHIFSDNSSTDETFANLLSIAKNDKNVKILRNSRNVGPFRNMWSAMKFATGDAIIPLLPADLQDPPEVIPKLVEKWEEGNLVTYGLRKNREEGFLMRSCRSIYYRLISRFAEAKIPVDAGEFLLADKRVVDSILSIDDQYPYIRGLIAQTGVQSASVEYTWKKRKRGRSSNGILDLFDQAINGFVSTSRAPARISLFFGFLFSIIGILGGIAIFIAFLVNRDGAPVGIPTAIVSIFMFGGFQLLFLGIIGEYVLSIHGQVRKTPPMFHISTINFDSKLD